VYTCTIHHQYTLSIIYSSYRIPSIRIIHITSSLLTTYRGIHITKHIIHVSQQYLFMHINTCRYHSSHNIIVTYVTNHIAISSYALYFIHPITFAYDPPRIRTLSNISRHAYTYLGSLYTNTTITHTLYQYMHLLLHIYHVQYIHRIYISLYSTHYLLDFSFPLSLLDARALSSLSRHPYLSLSLTSTLSPLESITPQPCLAIHHIASYLIMSKRSHHAYHTRSHTITHDLILSHTISIYRINNSAEATASINQRT
jgi:hypothetical protein